MSDSSAVRWLILHADDLGMNAAVTHGIVDGFSAGLLTSTSLLTNAPAAGLAVARWRQLEERRSAGALPSMPRRSRVGDGGAPFDLGVHLNLTQGRPLTGARYPDELLYEEGRFLPPGGLFRQLLLGGRCWRASIEQELSTQIEWLLDHRLTPTHLNGHQYIEMMPAIAEIVPQLARRFSISYVRAAREPGHWRTSLWPGMRVAKCGVSLVKQFYARRSQNRVKSAGLDTSDAYFGTSHAGRIDLALLGRFLRLSARSQRIEVALHPGRETAVSSADHACPDGWADPLARWRPAELRLLCSTDLAELLIAGGVRLGRLNVRPRRAAAA
ncbi:MAG TPA: ChbG/HpnK family deacetylase [Pirellulales bacterium]|nr:ChbG/HpnK family deacetylase [Pirellulales bacterium]